MMRPIRVNDLFELVRAGEQIAAGIPRMPDWLLGHSANRLADSMSALSAEVLRWNNTTGPPEEWRERMALMLAETVALLSAIADEMDVRPAFADMRGSWREMTRQAADLKAAVNKLRGRP